MGQQQLLLLVLGIIIVGLAVVSGTQAYSINQKKANTDALILTGMRIATDLQAWLQTPTALGGGMPATGAVPAVSSVSVSLRSLGYPVNATEQYETLDGNFSMFSSADGIVILGLSAALGTDGDNNSVTIEVKGIAVDDITTTIRTIAGAPPGS